MGSANQRYFSARRQRGVACLAAFLLAVVALWPSLTRAAAAEGLPAWAQQICSASGLGNPAPADEPADLAHRFEHCALCQLQRDVPALLPATVQASLPALALPRTLSPPPQAAPRGGSLRWSTAEPRAPPAAV